MECQLRHLLAVAQGVVRAAAGPCSVRKPDVKQTWVGAEASAFNSTIIGKTENE